MCVDSRQHFTLIVNNTKIPMYRLIKFLKTLKYIIDEADMEISMIKTHCNTSIGLLEYAFWHYCLYFSFRNI